MKIPPLFSAEVTAVSTIIVFFRSAFHCPSIKHSLSLSPLSLLFLFLSLSLTSSLSSLPHSILPSIFLLLPVSAGSYAFLACTKSSKFLTLLFCVFCFYFVFFVPVLYFISLFSPFSFSLSESPFLASISSQISCLFSLATSSNPMLNDPASEPVAAKSVYTYYLIHQPRAVRTRHALSRPS